MILGRIQLEDFLIRTHGLITGNVITDAKDRQYRQEYDWSENTDGTLTVQRRDGRGDMVTLSKSLPLDEALVAFFGLYSGDGAKGVEAPNEPGRIHPNISFSQKEPNLIRFAVDQFRRVFPGQIRFTFSLGEDSAYFMAGEGEELLRNHYLALGLAGTPPPAELASCRPNLDAADQGYLAEIRPDVQGSNEQHLAFYYTHKPAMEEILAAVKVAALASVGIDPTSEDVHVTASLRRPFKKGARQPGGSSRSDEIHIGGLNGIGELFLKIMHEIEDAVFRDSQLSTSGLIEWTGQPSQVGQILDLLHFFTESPYGFINNLRPKKIEPDGTGWLLGQWRASTETRLLSHLRIDPLWCYTSGLYLAEGTTDKQKMFRLFTEPVGALGLGFTSSEGTSIELMLRTLQKIFPVEKCLDAWKVKVGSQYFPELVVTGLKQGVAMLRGGQSGDGKLRTMEISLSIKQWALEVADVGFSEPDQSLLTKFYSDRYSHVEPTGSGVARIDFWASSALCKWYFPLVMFTVFGGIVEQPAGGFYS
jgi:hypothetical protein